MTTVAKNSPTPLKVAPDPGGCSAPSGDVRGAAFTAERISSNMVLIEVRGEIDVLSAPGLRAYVCNQVCADRRLILDLSGVDFIGTAGLSVFTSLDARTCQFGSGWALVGGRPVQRLLRAAGRASAFRCFESLEAAMHALRALNEEYEQPG